jgi:hypothetical protein
METALTSAPEYCKCLKITFTSIYGVYRELCAISSKIVGNNTVEYI